LGTAPVTVEPSIREHIAYLDALIEKIKRQIAGQNDSNPDLRGKRDLLGSIPGIGQATIAAILAEINIFERCDEVRKVVAFIGLAPKETVSGSSIKCKPRLCKIGHARLRKALYMPALVSIRYNPVIIDFYRRLKSKGKNGKVIVCATMRKLVHIIFGILKSGKPFDPNFTPHFA
jgi:transposase